MSIARRLPVFKVFWQLLVGLKTNRQKIRIFKSMLVFKSTLVFKFISAFKFDVAKTT